MERPTIRQLEYFVAVAEQLSFRRAAESCHVSQPALSSQVRAMEQTLGVALFERDRRRVLPTGAGDELLPLARDVLGASDRLLACAVGQAQPFAGTLRLGVIPTVAPYALPKVLSRVRRAYPELRVVLREERTGDLIALLRTGELDALLLALEAELGEVERVALWSDPFHMVAPVGHALSTRKRLRETDLDGLDLLLLDDGHCLRDQALAVCASHRVRERMDTRASSLPTLVQMVAGGLGATLLPASAVAVELRGLRELVAVPFVAPAPSRTIGLVWRRTTSRGDELRQLADEMRAVLPPGVVALRE